eukprot:758937-Hanusia_phi.AAC.2
MKYLFALAAIFAALAIAEGSVPVRSCLELAVHLMPCQVRKQAPAWKGKAVKNGEIVDLASSDFKVGSFRGLVLSHHKLAGQMAGSLFLSS